MLEANLNFMPKTTHPTCELQGQDSLHLYVTLLWEVTAHPLPFPRFYQRLIQSDLVRVLPVLSRKKHSTSPWFTPVVALLQRLQQASLGRPWIGAHHWRRTGQACMCRWQEQVTQAIDVHMRKYGASPKAENGYSRPSDYCRGGIHDVRREEGRCQALPSPRSCTLGGSGEPEAVGGCHGDAGPQSKSFL